MDGDETSDVEEIHQDDALQVGEDVSTLLKYGYVIDVIFIYLLFGYFRPQGSMSNKQRKEKKAE